MSVKLFFAGDIVNTRSVDNFISKELIDTISAHDISVCNFEAPLEGHGNKAIKAGPVVTQKIETIKILKNAGFNLFLLANNHIFDKGEIGLRATISEIEKNNIGSIGAGLNYSSAYQAYIKSINGITIGIINASEAQFGALDGSIANQKSGYAWLNHSLINDLVINTKKSVDKLILCAHAGLEGYDVPLIEWKERYKRLCDLGVDCIIGSHPHVAQGYEIYNNKPIFYSLGNFYFDSLSFTNIKGYTYSVSVELSKHKLMFELIYHHVDNSKVELTRNKTIDIDVLNSKLQNHDYLDQIYAHAFENITNKYIASVNNAILKNDSLLQIFIKLLLKVIKSKSKNQKRQLLLLHLFRNETYRWVTIRALTNKYFNLK